MIKDKITPELRSRFIEDIKRSKESGKERGFFLCENKEGKLIPSKSCEGTECSIHLGDPSTGCPSETTTYGNFHTHPYLYSVKQELRRDGKILPKEELKISEELKSRMRKNIGESHERITGVKGITINSPSYTDILKALLAKSINLTNGTVCTSTDVETSRVECWTIKDLGKDRLKRLAITGMAELDKIKSEGSGLTKKWLDDISDRETIEL
jgi:hypothetical protein